MWIQSYSNKNYKLAEANDSFLDLTLIMMKSSLWCLEQTQGILDETDRLEFYLGIPTKHYIVFYKVSMFIVNILRYWKGQYLQGQILTRQTFTTI